MQNIGAAAAARIGAASRPRNDEYGARTATVTQASDQKIVIGKRAREPIHGSEGLNACARGIRAIPTLRFELPSSMPDLWISTSFDALASYDRQTNRAK